jgi:hypothetical protein
MHGSFLSLFSCANLLVAQSFSFLFKKNLNSKKKFQEGFFLLLRSMERSLMWKLHVDGGWDREPVYQTWEIHVFSMQSCNA